MNLDLMIREVQASLGCSVDGKAGPQTWAAIHGRIVGTSRVVPSAEIDARSAKNIATLHPKVRDYARALIQAAAKQGIRIKVIEATRTYEQQDKIFAQPHDGKDNDGDGRIDEADEKVTGASGGHSNHNFGIAFDVGIFDATDDYIEESPLYKAVGSLGMALGLTWGGNWKSIEDQPHFQLRPAWAAQLSESQMVTELRRRHEIGEDVFA